MASQPEIVREWLATLAALIGLKSGEADAEQKLGIFVPYLLQAVPIEAFCPASVGDIARTCTYMPGYAGLCEKLQGWWFDHRPDKPSRIEYIPQRDRVEIPQRRPPPSEEEIAYVTGLVTALTADLKRQAEQREAARPQTGRQRIPARLSDGQLLAIYEQSGPSGAIRAQALRKKIHDETLAHMVAKQSAAYKPVSVQGEAQTWAVRAEAGGEKSNVDPIPNETMYHPDAEERYGDPSCGRPDDRLNTRQAAPRDCRHDPPATGRPAPRPAIPAAAPDDADRPGQGEHAPLEA